MRFGPDGAVRVDYRAPGNPRAPKDPGPRRHSDGSESDLALRSQGRKDPAPRRHTSEFISLAAFKLFLIFRGDLGNSRPSYLLAGAAGKPGAGNLPA
jgi:hypothetical protein